MRRAARALACAALALAALDAQAINKCVDRAGKVTYQEAPCAGQAKQQAMKVPVPATTKAHAPAAPPPPSRDTESSGGVLPRAQDRDNPALQELASTLALYEGCQAVDPVLVGKHRAEYEAWRMRNREAIEELPRSRRYMVALQSARQRVQGELSVKDTRAEFVRRCESQLLSTLAH
jgi:hypothetical protein